MNQSIWNFESCFLSEMIEGGSLAKTPLFRYCKEKFFLDRELEGLIEM